jgi:phosphoesterase RecJ-like protein
MPTLKNGKIDVMAKYDVSDKLDELIKNAKSIVIIQADNPDGDSIASSLALEQILGEMGKTVNMYCGVDIPLHLRHLAGYDRIDKELPHSFDLSIIVDTSTETLLEQLDITDQKKWVKSKPSIIIDHHDVPMNIPYATLICRPKAVATGEVIYELCEQLGWPRGAQTNNFIATAILSDSLGLMSEGTTPRSIHIIADLVDSGVILAELESARRDTMRRSPELVFYKGQLLQRVEYYADNRVAVITIPWHEIETYSHAYNPSMLVLDDMRLTEGTKVAIAFKTYPSGRITGKIRCNYGSAIANLLAAHFGGGGHPYASGFKITDHRPYNEIKIECIQKAVELLDALETHKEPAHETA